MIELILTSNFDGEVNVLCNNNTLTNCDLERLTGKSILSIQYTEQGLILEVE